MATPYNDIYAYFLLKVNDYSFANMDQSDLEDMLKDYLKVAVSKFAPYSNVKLDRDDTSNQFYNDLSDEEKNILATLMVVEYLQSKLLTSDLLQQMLSDKDYRIYSQANQIKELRLLYSQMKADAENLITKYSYRYLNLGGNYGPIDPV